MEVFETEVIGKSTDADENPGEQSDSDNELNDW